MSSPEKIFYKQLPADGDKGLSDYPAEGFVEYLRSDVAAQQLAKVTEQRDKAVSCLVDCIKDNLRWGALMGSTIVESKKVIAACTAEESTDAEKDEVCPECGGTGHYRDENPNTGGMQEYECSSCNGSGKRVSK